MRVLAGTSESVVSRRNVDIVEKRAWQRSTWVNDYVRPARLDHFLGSMRRLASSKIEGFGFMRAARSRPFSDEDRELLELVHVGVGRVFDDSFADLKLAPRVRETLEAMLSGAAQDKDIAARLGISPHTVREYVKTIYKTYRVSNRAELISRFVRARR
jgi:DNA-binding CsgD family transcriptional regulator